MAKAKNPSAEKKKDLLRVTFVFSEEDWNALGFSEKPDPMSLKKAVYDLIHSSADTPETLPPVFGTATVASLFHVNQQTAKIWAQEGEIPATKVRGRWRFTREDVLNYMKERDARAEQKKKQREKQAEKAELEAELRKIRSLR